MLSNVLIEPTPSANVRMAAAAKPGLLRIHPRLEVFGLEQVEMGAQLVVEIALAQPAAPPAKERAQSVQHPDHGPTAKARPMASAMRFQRRVSNSSRRSPARVSR